MTVAVVTGAAGGIGAAICRRLAADGFEVACADVREADAVALAAELPAARGYGADVRDPASVHAAARRIRADLGEPWLLVNAAGVFSIQRLVDLDEAEWDAIIEICPGLIDTEMADWIRHDEQAMADFAARTPAGRIGTPADIAGAVAYLASAGASYLQGAVLMVDGGVTA